MPCHSQKIWAQNSCLHAVTPRGHALAAEPLGRNMRESGRTGSQIASRLNRSRFPVRRSQFPVYGGEGGQSEKTDGTYGTHATYGNLIRKIAHSLKRDREPRTLQRRFLRRYSVAGSIPRIWAASSIVLEFASTFLICSFSISSRLALPPRRNSVVP